MVLNHSLSEIPTGLIDSEWETFSSGATTTFGAGSSECNNFSPAGDACDESWSLDVYGRLYNWFAVVDARGLCPSGWHVSSDADWSAIEIFIGMDEDEVAMVGNRGVDEATVLKTGFGWYEMGFGTDLFGMACLPGGYRDSEGPFDTAGADCYFFAPSNSDSGIWSRSLAFDSNTIGRYPTNNPNDGFSIRCIKD